jgi:hypothetical protein
MSLRPLKITPFPKRSVTTMIFVRPWLGFRSVTKSIEISLHNRSGIGKGFKNPWRRSLHGVLALHASQFRTNLRTSSYILGQKYWRARMAPVESLPGCPQALESWVPWIIFVRSSSSSGTHSRSRNSRRPSLSSVHSATDTFSLR